MTHPSRRTFLGTTGGLAAMLALGGRVSIAQTAEGTVLRARLQRDLEILDPGYMIGGQEMAVQNAIFPHLAVLDLSGESVTWMPSAYVTRLELVEPTRIEFDLKPGLMWTDGFGEFTAEDVKYSFDRIKDTDWGGRWGELAETKVTGTHSGALILSEPSAPFMTNTLSNGVGTILCKAAMEGLAEGQFTLTMPASCGPYVLAEHVLKQKMTLRRNPDWTETRPDFDVIELIVVEDATAAELAFEAGELDITDISSRNIPRYVENPVPDSEIYVAGNLQYAWVGMNTEHPKLQDIRVRKAIQQAINVDQIQSVAFKDVAEKATGIVPPGLLGHRPEAGYAFDIEAAKALIDEAGAEGLELSLVTLADERQRLLAAQIIQENLAQIGVKVNIQPLDSGAFWSYGRESKGDAWQDSQLWIMRFGGTVDPSDYFQWFTTDQKGNWNWERWSSAEFDQIYRDSVTETDPDKRTEMYHRLQQMMEDTGAYVWLNHEPEAFLHSTRIRPLIDPNGVYRLPSFELVS